MEEGLRRRRRDPRYGLQGAVPVSDSRGSPHFKPLFIAAGVDMSYQGIGLMTPEAMKVGAIYYVNLRNFGKEQYVLPLRVVHCNMMARGMFRVGAQLLQ